MELTITFNVSVLNIDTAPKIKHVAELIQQGYTEGINIPEGVNWVLHSADDRQRVLIAGSKLNNKNI